MLSNELLSFSFLTTLISGVNGVLFERGGIVRFLAKRTRRLDATGDAEFTTEYLLLDKIKLGGLGGGSCGGVGDEGEGELNTDNGVGEVD